MGRPGDSEYEYWCHQCRQSVIPLFVTYDEITCTRCHGGFVQQRRRRTLLAYLTFRELRHRNSENEVQRNGYGTPPASKSAVQAMSTVTVSPEHLPSECAVCLEDCQEGEVTCQMPCQHIYHSHCILPWLELHSCCPVCRFQMPVRDHQKQRPSCFISVLQVLCNFRHPWMPDPFSTG
jgi:hypothetical protein